MIISRNSKARYQRDISLSEYADLGAAIAEKGDAVAQLDPVAVLSYMGELFELNITSALFWEAIERPTEYEDVVHKISLIFDVDISVLSDDLVSVIGEFESASLVNVKM